MDFLNDVICMNRYTYDAWKKLYPDHGYDEWKLFNVPNNVSEFIIERLFERKEMNSSALELAQTCIITIDQDYISWLNGREHTLNNLFDYINQVSIKDLNDKFLNGRMNIDLSIEYFIVYVPTSDCLENPDKKKLYISNEISEKIEEMLNADSIYQYYVPGYILPEIAFLNTKTNQDIFTSAETFLFDHVRTFQGKYREFVKTAYMEEHKSIRYAIPVVRYKIYDQVFISNYDLQITATKRLLHHDIIEYVKEKCVEVFENGENIRIAPYIYPEIQMQEVISQKNSAQNDEKESILSEILQNPKIILEALKDHFKGNF